MKRISLAMLMLSACLLLTSCGENHSATTDARSPSIPESTGVATASRPLKATSIATISPATPGQPSGSQPSAIVSPPGAQWTLYCRTIRGPGHVEESSRLKSQLAINPRLKEWYLIHKEDDSIVCYGYYANITDAHAQNDRRRIEALLDASGQPIFTGVCFQPIVSPDPDAPPEWNLAKLPGRKYWSLEIAAFRADPLRKKAAVQAVRDLRQQGIEAYYYHGPTISSVCIGAWPIEAVKRQGETNVAQSSDPDTALFVVGDVLPQDARPPDRDRDGKKLVTLAPKLEVVDPTLKAAIRKWPEHAVNYMVNEITTPDGQKIRDPSFLIIIPHPELAGQDPFAGATDPIGPDDPDAVRVPHGTGTDVSTGAGKLRTLGEH